MVPCILYYTVRKTSSFDNDIKSRGANCVSYNSCSGDNSDNSDISVSGSVSMVVGHR